MSAYLLRIVGLVRIISILLIGRVLRSHWLPVMARIGPLLKRLRHESLLALLAQGAPLDYQRSIRGDVVAIFIF